MNSHGISVVPPFGARRYLHKFVKLLDVNITTFPLQEQMQDLLRVKIRTYKNNKFRERERERERDAYPPIPVMENCRTWMVFARSIMVILLLVGFATSFILTNPWLI